MTRRRIELHNIDKYQPYFHAPMIDRIEGDAEEMILSADGNETSSSGNTVGSLTINSSGGVWNDLGDVKQVTMQINHTYTTPGAGGSEVIFDMLLTDVTYCTLNIVLSSDTYVAHKQINALHDESTVTVSDNSSQTLEVGSLPGTTSFSGSINNDRLEIEAAGLDNTQVLIRGVVTAIKI